MFTHLCDPADGVYAYVGYLAAQSTLVKLMRLAMYVLLFFFSSSSIRCKYACMYEICMYVSMLYRCVYVCLDCFYICTNVCMCMPCMSECLQVQCDVSFEQTILVIFHKDPKISPWKVITTCLSMQNRVSYLTSKSRAKGAKN